MNSNSIREFIINKGVVIQFQNKYQYNEYNLDKIIKLPIIENSCYDNWDENWHHLKTSYHFEHTIPTIENILQFNYSRNDFIKIEKTVDEFDISYLVPKNNNLKFDIICYTLNKQHINVDYNFLCKIDMNDNEKNNCLVSTDYHKMFIYPHNCSRIINKSVNNERILFISGDSQLIPIIPLICCYFKEVWYFDNRTDINCIKNLENINITDVLFCIGYNEQSKYFVDNLK